MKAYSLDFREKIVSAYKAGNTSIRKIAERFMVTKRTVHRLIKQKEETGDLTPKKVGRKKPSVAIVKNIQIGHYYSTVKN